MAMLRYEGPLWILRRKIEGLTLCSRLIQGEIYIVVFHLSNCIEPCTSFFRRRHVRIGSNSVLLMFECTDSHSSSLYSRLKTVEREEEEEAAIIEREKSVIIS
jgi:hypothetical protein